MFTAVDPERRRSDQIGRTPVPDRGKGGAADVCAD